MAAMSSECVNDRPGAEGHDIGLAHGAAVGDGIAGIQLRSLAERMNLALLPCGTARIRQ
jgi:hypothetical protein